MKRSPRPKEGRPASRVLLAALLAGAGPVSCGRTPEPLIDAHSHLHGKTLAGETDYGGAAKAALARMDALGIEKALIMPPPMQEGFPGLHDCEDFLPALKKHPARFAFLGGGGTLNAMIQRAVRAGKTSAALRKEFRARAEKIAASGAAGFGELAAEHLSFVPRHPYEYAPPDHPLFLLLADIAAEKNMAIDLHMEAAAKDLPAPERWRNTRNPGTLRANLAGLERLLAHDRGARIVWAHAGWDNTGDRTAALCGELLARHPNLYMSLKLEEISLQANSPLEGRRLKPEWLELFKAFPDRFVIGTDQFYASPKAPFPWAGRGGWVKGLLDQLPAELRRKVAVENVHKIYPRARKDL